MAARLDDRFRRANEADFIGMSSGKTGAGAHTLPEAAAPAEKRARVVSTCMGCSIRIFIP
ncbi:hypothetical protein K32_28960 [Kaistia sp. 32K]|nr:hypothetical protein K32_28960 [Kaistia sp. 32K]